MSAALNAFYEGQFHMEQETLRNDPDLYLWVMGWIAEKYRGKETLSAMGEAIAGYDPVKSSMTGTGYKKLEKGSSSNFRTWCYLWEHHDKDIVSILTVVRVLVRRIQEVEKEEGRRLNKDERGEAISELYAMFK